MASKGNMTLRIEPELKAQAAELFKSLGLDLSTATGIFYRQALRCRGLPFEVRLDPNEETYAAMEVAENDKDLEGPFDSVSELIEALKAKAGFTGQFKKDYKLAVKRGVNPEKLEKVVSLLCSGVTLPPAYKDHLLYEFKKL